MRRLVVNVFWADDPDLDELVKVMKPYKAEGTEGYFLTYHGDDAEDFRLACHAASLHTAAAGPHARNPNSRDLT